MHIHKHNPTVHELPKIWSTPYLALPNGASSHSSFIDHSRSIMVPMNGDWYASKISEANKLEHEQQRVYALTSYSAVSPFHASTIICI